MIIQEGFNTHGCYLLVKNQANDLTQMFSLLHVIELIFIEF